MTYNLIHDRGRVIRVEQRPFEDKTTAVPHERQRPRGFWTMWREWRMPKAHNGYKPGLIYDLGGDQCRFIEGDDHVMCGKKVREKSSYCQHHHERAHAAPKPPSEPTSLRPPAGQVKRMTSAYKVDDPLDEER